MFKGLIRVLGLMFLLCINQNAWAKTGNLFVITESGAAANISINLCLNVNGKKAVSCQNYEVHHATLTIRAALPHNYPNAGIRINTPGYNYHGVLAPSGYYFLGLLSATSSQTVTITSSDVPGAPTGVQATPGNGEIVVSWTPPEDSGGSAITGYTVNFSPSGGVACTATPPATSCTIPGLDNGTTYSFTVTATNGSGSGPASPLTPSSSATPENNLFIVTSSGDGHETISPTVASVVSGATQAFTVTANTGYVVSQNVTGTCPQGTWVGSVYTTGAITANCSVSFSATVEHFTVSATGDANVTPSPTSQSVNYNQTGTVTLTVTTGYIVSIASNTCGGTLTGTTFTTGAVTQNCSVTFSSATVPGAPTNLSGTPEVASVALTWTAPTDNGGSAITSYEITYTSGGTPTSIATGSTATSYTVPNLTNGTAYTFTVAATNVLGTGNVSNTAGPMTPELTPRVPIAPTNLSGTPGSTSVALMWTAPSDNGGSPITSYEVKVYENGILQVVFTTSNANTSYTVTGLNTGTAYTFTVAATNAIGTGPASAVLGPITTVATPTVPNAPTNLRDSCKWVGCFKMGRSSR